MLVIVNKLKHMACYAHQHEILGHRHFNLPVCALKDFRYWSHISITTTHGNKLLLICSEKNDGKKNEKKKKQLERQLQSFLHY